MSENLASTHPEAHVGELLVGPQTRNDWLEAQLNDDPTKPLPIVELKLLHPERRVVEIPGVEAPIPKSQNSHHHYDIHDTKRRRLGYVVIREAEAINGQKPQHHIGDIKILDRGKGYGPATYLAILKNLPLGVGLKSRGKLEEGSQKAWQRLVNKGVAKRIDSEDGDPEAYETIF